MRQNGKNGERSNASHPPNIHSFLSYNSSHSPTTSNSSIRGIVPSYQPTAPISGFRLSLLSSPKRHLMPFDGGSMTPSPRSRRANRPLPFIAMPPPTSFSQHSLADSSCHSRPPSPGHWAKAVNQVQSVLYGGKGSKDDIAFTVSELYDVNASEYNLSVGRVKRRKLIPAFARSGSFREPAHARKGKQGG